MATHAPLPCCRRSIVKGQEVIVIETSSGQQITLQNSPASVLIEDANGNAIRLDATGVTITTGATLTINASQIEISAGQVIVNAGMTQFSGVVQADTVIANSVVASSYIPGAGNIW
jgi:hypothetical protein